MDRSGARRDVPRRGGRGRSGTATPLGVGLWFLGRESVRERRALGYLARMLGGDGLLPGRPRTAARGDGGGGAARGRVAHSRAARPRPAARRSGAAGRRRRRRRAVVLPTAGARDGLVVAPVVSWSVDGERRHAPVAPRNEADLLRGVQQMYDSAEDGPVGVQRLDHDDGRRTWVVTIPGMQSLGPPGPATTDLLSSVQGPRRGTADDLSELDVRRCWSAGSGRTSRWCWRGTVRAGWRRSGSRERTTDTFTVTTVLLAHRRDARPGRACKVLSLEHDEDLVWGISRPPEPGPAEPAHDGPECGRRRGCRRWRRAGPRGYRFGGGHVLYTRPAAAEQVAGDDHLSVRAFEASLAGVLGDGTAEVTE